MNVGLRHVAADLQTKPTDLGCCQSSCSRLLLSTSTIAIYYYSARNWYSFSYRVTEGKRPIWAQCTGCEKLAWSLYATATGLVIEHQWHHVAPCWSTELWPLNGGARIVWNGDAAKPKGPNSDTWNGDSMSAVIVATLSARITHDWHNWVL